MPAPRQLSLELRARRCFRRADFIVAASNAEATALLDAWPAWPDRRLALVGPEGSGKTHLARAWAATAGAAVLASAGDDLGPLDGRPVLVEDADAGGSDELLFHLFNRTQGGSGLLLTARTAPRRWPVTLPDLRSRLNALTVASVAAPDDAVLEGILANLFRERNIRPAEGVVSYLVRRMERSGAAAIDLVARIDEIAAAEGQEVTRALARRVIETGAATLDLFP